MTDKLYRYDAAPADNELGAEVVLRTYKVEKETKCGVWILVNHKKKFVHLGSMRQYASVTKERALQQFIYRKKKQIKILTSQLEVAKVGLMIAEEGSARDKEIISFGSLNGNKGYR